MWQYLVKKVPNIGGRQMASVLSFCSYDPSSNSAEVHSFYSVQLLKMKINKNDDGQFKKHC